MSDEDKPQEGSSSDDSGQDQQEETNGSGLEDYGHNVIEEGFSQDVEGVTERGGDGPDPDASDAEPSGEQG